MNELDDQEFTSSSSSKDQSENVPDGAQPSFDNLDNNVSEKNLSSSDSRWHRVREFLNTPLASAYAPTFFNTHSILKVGRNCWRHDLATQVAFLVDASDFFKAFYEAAQKAEKQIIILGWDTDSRVELLVGDRGPSRMRFGFRSR